MVQGDCLAMIIGRGGSKRIPHKNRRLFLGKPIICYPIAAAISAGVFSEVMVSTDDPEIASIARQAGAQVPFARSPQTAGDYATTDEVIEEVLSRYRERGREFDAFCCIYPTAPLLTAQRLREAMAMLDGADSVMPVTPFSFPVQRGLVLTQKGQLRYREPEHAGDRSQDLEKVYHDCGQFYACRTRPFLTAKTTDLEDLVPLFLTELEAQDIDTPEDWEIAELKYQILQKRLSAEGGLP